MADLALNESGTVVEVVLARLKLGELTHRLTMISMGAPP
jgi:hypothetical protein